MPGRNITKLFAPESCYHVYNRGVNRRLIFKDEADYDFFTKLFTRYIGNKPTTDSKGRIYPWYGERLSLLAYCLMPNHFHLLINQEDESAMTQFMLSLGTAYTMYFNKKYKRRGPLFENHYRASLINNDVYLQHISRYIHLNPIDYADWLHSSLGYYLGRIQAGEWLNTEPVLELFDSVQQYRSFVTDYGSMQRELEMIKHELADTMR